MTVHDEQAKGQKILEDLYRAKVSEGRTRYSLPRKIDIDYVAGEKHKIDLHPIKVYHGVQLDLPPWDYAKLTSQISYLHSDMWGRDPMNPSSVAEQHYSEVYQREFEDEELRRKYPMLQQFWDRYQSLKILLQTGEAKGNEDG